MTPGNKDAKVGDPLFLLAFEHAPIGMALVGPDYRLQRVNKALTEILGFSEAELVVRDFVDLTHPDDIHRATNLSATMKSIAGEFHINDSNITVDGAFDCPLAPSWQRTLTSPPQANHAR